MRRAQSRGMRPYVVIVRLGGRGYRTLGDYLRALDEARRLAEAGGREVWLVDADGAAERPLIVASPLEVTHGQHTTRKARLRAGGDLV